MIRVPAPGETQADRIERMLADVHEALPVLHRLAADTDAERLRRAQDAALDRSSERAGRGRQGGRGRKRKPGTTEAPALRLHQGGGR